MTPQPMTITGKQMSRIYNAGSMQEVHSVMDEIRDIYEVLAPEPTAPEPDYWDDVARNWHRELLTCERCTVKSEDNCKKCPLPEHDATIRNQTLDEERRKNIFVIKLDSSEYVNPRSDDEKLSNQLLYSIRVVTEDEDASYILLEEQYLKMASSIKKWIKRTFQRINRQDGIKTESLRHTEAQR